MLVAAPSPPDFLTPPLAAAAASRRRSAARTVAALLVAGFWFWPATATSRQKPAAPASAEVAAKQTDLRELRERIDGLRRDLDQAEASRADVADRLRDSEREISGLHRGIRNLAGQRAGVEAALQMLQSQSRGIEATLADQRRQLERLLYHQYVEGRPDALHLLLNGDDPNATARELHYLSAIARARSDLLRQMSATLAQKRGLADDTRERAAALAAIERQQREQHGRLLAQREQRKQVLTQISAQIQAQRKEIGTLERDERRLTQLIDRLSKIIARRQAKPPRKPAPATRGEPDRARPAEIENERTPEAGTGGAFARLRGSLRLPVRGTVANRFGSPRQEGSTWKGLFIRAAAGGEVKAIAAGRVVFADWMRGFGNLLIVDHGGTYLSIYGNNESLFKQVGDGVMGGEAVASVGNSGGNPESGLYFELRHQGQPLDPLKWVNLR